MKPLQEFNTPTVSNGVGASYARQESVVILLNLFALAALFTVHLTFRHITDLLSLRLVLVLLAARLLEQGGELLALRRWGASLTARQVAVHARLSIAVNIIFAGLVSVAANSVDAHYTVLLIIPVIAAAFRLSFGGLVIVILSATVLSFLMLWTYFLRHPPVDVEEFFEIATEGLVFAVIGFVSWGLARNMRRDAVTLKRAMDDLQSAQDKLVAEEKLAAVGRLSSAIAHEIRNPVGVIVSALQTAERPEVTDTTKHELRAMAATEAARLERITAEFLSYARSRTPEKQPVAVCDVIEYAAGLLRAQNASAGPVIEVDCSPSLTIQADAFQIHQALLNLGLNAIQHTPAEGKVLLGAYANGRTAFLYVENTGPPVSADADIFEPFYTTRPKGTGLGLPISRNIARAHAGDLVLAKNDPGAVRFLLTLPMES
jgi:signal transduction histidine kinase